MKKRSIIYKITAFILILVFTFQSLHSINSHAYTISVDNYHYEPNCYLGNVKTHLSQNCNSQESIHF